MGALVREFPMTIILKGSFVTGAACKGSQRCGTPRVSGISGLWGDIGMFRLILKVLKGDHSGGYKNPY